ncbi:MAG TPA: hypothetical protein VFC19_54145 [Candidatus Limnocylindrales bacterium]|nr:hypothetical protein [Candidatus Limnocylindrales bacterium]
MRADIGVSAFPFELGQVRLTASRWLDNQNRTLSYLRFVDVDRLRTRFVARVGRLGHAPFAQPTMRPYYGNGQIGTNVIANNRYIAAVDTAV